MFLLQHGQVNVSVLNRSLRLLVPSASTFSLRGQKISYSAFKKDNKPEQEVMASMKETNRLKVALEQAKGPSMGCWYVQAQGIARVGLVLIGRQANASWSQCFKGSCSDGC